MSDIPHKAIINISFSVYPVDPTGEVSGHTVHRSTLGSAGCKHKVLQVIGTSLDDCLKKLKDKVDSIK